MVGRPAASAAAAGCAASDSTAIIRTPGFSRRITEPMPLIRPPPPNGTMTVSKLEILHNLRADGGVARHHGGIGDRMEEDAFDPVEAPGLQHLPPIVERNADHPGAQRFQLGGFGGRGAVGRDDGDGNAKIPRGKSQAQAEIAGAGRQHAGAKLLRVGGLDGVDGGADLERAQRLQIFQLDADLDAGHIGVEPPERRAPRNARDVAAGGLDLFGGRKAKVLSFPKSPPASREIGDRQKHQPGHADDPGQVPVLVDPHGHEQRDQQSARPAICMAGNSGMRTGSSAARCARRKPIWLTRISTQTMMVPNSAIPCR